MKKIIIITLCTAMFLILASCGSAKASGAAASGIETATQTQTATAAPAVQQEAVPEAPEVTIAEEDPVPAAPEADANVLAQAQADIVPVSSLPGIPSGALRKYLRRS